VEISKFLDPEHLQEILRAERKRQRVGVNIASVIGDIEHVAVGRVEEPVQFIQQSEAPVSGCPQLLPGNMMNIVQAPRVQVPQDASQFV
jgi:hypothetical protein